MGQKIILNGDRPSSADSEAIEAVEATGTAQQLGPLDDAIAAVKACWRNWVESFVGIKVVGADGLALHGCRSCMRPAYVSSGHFISIVADPGSMP